MTNRQRILLFEIAATLLFEIAATFVALSLVGSLLYGLVRLVEMFQ